jgi:O-methyltransferase
MSYEQSIVPPFLAWRINRAQEWAKIIFNREDIRASWSFMVDPTIPFSSVARLRLLLQFYRISLRVESPHRQSEILQFVAEILRSKGDGQGAFVEAGCYKGGSAAKFSLAARLAGRTLYLFDSFEGLPENDEQHGTTIFGDYPNFTSGKYSGSIEEVKQNITHFGAIEVCCFVKGWFEDTMTNFREPLLGVYLDVDLASSTRTCIKQLYPLLIPAGTLISQDGHLPLVINVFDDEAFWRDEVGVAKPVVKGLGKSKLISIRKLI